MFSHLKPGDEVYFVPYPSSYTAPYSVVVDKIGRTWIYATRSNLRFDKNSGVADGGQYASPGRVYLTKEAYTDLRRLGEMWKEFCKQLNPYSTPDKMTTEKIQRIQAIIKE